MTLENVVDIEKLLSPIQENTPQGEDIREDRSPTSDYYTIKDARNSARAAERSAVSNDESESDVAVMWRQVISLADRLLSSKTKDLEVAVWYLEGLVRVHGVAGLRDGLSVIQGLIESFWDNLFPLPDEDGIETRVSSLTGLNGDGGEGTLLAPLRNLSIVESDSLGGLSFWQYLQARDADRIEDEDKKAERLAVLGYDLSAFNSAVSSTNIAECQAVVAAFEESLQTYSAITNALREKCGNDAPPSSKISELLNELTRTVRFIYKEKLEQAQAIEQQKIAESESFAAEEAQSEQPSNVVAISNMATGKITNREDALKRLEDVAKYFRQYEPHTPIAPGIERLIQWGRMTVADLMMELIPDNNARSLFSQYTGVKLDGSDEHTYVAAPVATTVAPAESIQQPAEKPAAAEQPAASKW